MVIPVGKGEQPYLKELISDLKHQTVECEIILISTGNIGEARRDGVLQATCDIVAFVDSDCTLPSDWWMEQMLAPFSDPDVVCTHTLGTYHENDPAIMRYSVLTFDESLLDSPTFRPGTGHTLIRKSAILEGGNFKPVAACEDLLLTKTLKGKFVYMPDLKLRHHHATTIKQYLWKQYRTTKGCREAAKLYDPHYLYNDNSAREFRNRQIKRNTRMFFRALIGKEDHAWLLWPFLGMCQFIIYRVISKW